MENLKFKLRQKYKNIRRNLNQERRLEASSSLAHTFGSTEGFICSYASFGDELDTTCLNQSLLTQNRLVLPKIEGTNLAIYFVRDFIDLEFSAYGILEPKPHCQKIPFEKVFYFLIPGIAFDKNNNRLGYGKGYYDRFLANKENEISTIGIGFKESFSESQFPISKHDIKLKQLALF